MECVWISAPAWNPTVVHLLSNSFPLAVPALKSTSIDRSTVDFVGSSTEAEQLKHEVSWTLSELIYPEVELNSIPLKVSPAVYVIHDGWFHFRVVPVEVHVQGISIFFSSKIAIPITPRFFAPAPSLTEYDFDLSKVNKNSFTLSSEILHPSTLRLENGLMTYPLSGSSVASSPDKMLMPSIEVTHKTRLAELFFTSI